jgi:hypothetical protein
LQQTQSIYAGISPYPASPSEVLCPRISPLALLFTEEIFSFLPTGKDLQNIQKLTCSPASISFFSVDTMEVRAPLLRNDLRPSGLFSPPAGYLIITSST